jgi:hypothetical protein
MRTPAVRGIREFPMPASPGSAPRQHVKDQTSLGHTIKSYVGFPRTVEQAKASFPTAHALGVEVQAAVHTRPPDGGDHRRAEQHTLVRSRRQPCRSSRTSPRSVLPTAPITERDAGAGRMGVLSAGITAEPARSGPGSARASGNRVVTLAPGRSGHVRENRPALGSSHCQAPYRRRRAA